MTNKKKTKAEYSAMQAARWAIPVDLATLSASIFDGFEISGDHRPRHRRLYARGIGGDAR